MKLTINRKMMLGFGMIIILMIIANAYVLFQLTMISRTARVTLTSEVRSIDIAKHLETILYEEERHGQKYLISRDRAYYDLFIDGGREFNDAADSLRGMQVDRRGRQLVEELQRNHLWLSASVVPPNPRRQQASSVSWEWNDRRRLDTLGALHRTLENLIQLNQLAIDNAMTNVEAITTRSSSVAFLLTLGTLAVAIGLTIVIPRTLTKPIKVLIKGTEQIAAGSFEPIRTTSHDEIAQLTEAVNDMSAKLKQVDEHRTALLHTISHELRSPFQAIMAALFAIRRQGLDMLNARQVEMLDTIQQSVHRANSYTNQLLDIAKIDAGMMEYNFKPVDLRPLIEPVIENARLIASQRNISIGFSAQAVPPIMGDEEKIAAIVNNLLSNAIKYTDRGGRISASLLHVESFVRIVVEDSGIGIAPEDLPKIFRKFYQAKNAGMAASKGTGIGLAIVKAYTEAHGGTVSVTSTPGSGTSFMVDLPVTGEAFGNTEVSGKDSKNVA